MARTVAVSSRKGGVGKSTLAFSFACRAAQLGRRVLLVSADPQGDSARWAGGGDRRLRRDDVFESEWGFHAVYSPGSVPELPEDAFDLAVVDLPPQAESIRWVRPDVWLSPQDGRNSVLDTLPVLPAMREQGGLVLFAVNRADAAGQRALEMVHDALRSVRDAYVWDQPLPDSGVIARVAECAAPPWEVPYGKSAAGTRAVEQLCDWLLRSKALAPGTTRPRRRAARR